MSGPRKVFRIEELAAAPVDPSVEDTEAAQRYTKIMHELSALRAMLAAATARQSAAAAPQSAEMARLAAELDRVHAAISGTSRERGGSCVQPTELTRVADGLGAALKGSDGATQKILAAAEAIDQAAGNLSAALKGAFEQGLAQDIRDRVIQIFEACNFQDLASQRVVKVMTTLLYIEGQIARAFDASPRTDEAPPLQGPRRESDCGDDSQCDIDAMFRRPSSA